ncbi:hypothetical protein PCASD_07990 [Puccinia coronata f. sp. avenae]|uniref:Uncharacterized protein n=1 Tax=Puccinia coronata f. sp. avenae TaxID=200324 RepID=A0A2N5UNY7_9BASI|nr:hypothetical protein PCASD_07990 [Puccinia coronata f. sp. avenae]
MGDSADDRDLFFSDFATAFAKLLELGVKRDQHAYKPADKPNSSSQDAEAEPVHRGNTNLRQVHPIGGPGNLRAPRREAAASEGPPRPSSPDPP